MAQGSERSSSGHYSNSHIGLSVLNCSKDETPSNASFATRREISVLVFKALETLYFAHIFGRINEFNKFPAAQLTVCMRAAESHPPSLQRKRTLSSRELAVRFSQNERRASRNDTARNRRNLLLVRTKTSPIQRHFPLLRRLKHDPATEMNEKYSKRVSFQ